MAGLEPHSSRRRACEPDHLELGREHYRQRAWAEASRALAAADAAAPLGAEDLELLAMAGYLVGRDEDYLAALERAHHAWVGRNEPRRAARCAFWLGLRLLFRGETGRSTGWLARGQRLLEPRTEDCAEQGYLLLPVVEQQLAAGDHAAAYANAETVAAIGERCAEADLIACARHLQGRIRLRQGRVTHGLALLDETMIAVAGGELSPMVTGLMYCSLIDACRQVYALDRAREWTAALAQWCDAQPEMVSFTGVCQVHRAEIMQLGGDWAAAIEQARRACGRAAGDQPAAAAHYQQAEIHRLVGAYAAAEQSYRAASALGLEPQPGLALLRLAQGQGEAAMAALRRASGAVTDPLQRARLLPALVEVALEVGDLDGARGASRELDGIAGAFDTEALGGMAAQARGSVALAAGEPQAALGPLRHAVQVWQRIDAPYLAARVRVLIGRACRALGDEEGAGLEIAAAAAAFERLGAAPDLARIDREARPPAPYRLTPRELQVLRLVAAGDTNKAIAGKLSLSEKTVDRHVSNILTRLDVPSRAAATAVACRCRLI